MSFGDGLSGWVINIVSKVVKAAKIDPLIQSGFSRSGGRVGAVDTRIAGIRAPTKITRRQTFAIFSGRGSNDISQPELDHLYWIRIYDNNSMAFVVIVLPNFIIKKTPGWQTHC